MNPYEFVGALARTSPRELGELGRSLGLGRPAADPLSMLATLFSDVADDGPDPLAEIRAKRWMRVMRLEQHEDLRQTLLERLDGLEAPWNVVVQALR
jgi:hypothetical protein